MNLYDRIHVKIVLIDTFEKKNYPPNLNINSLNLYMIYNLIHLSFYIDYNKKQHIWCYLFTFSSAYNIHNNICEISSYFVLLRKYKQTSTETILYKTIR